MKKAYSKPLIAVENIQLDSPIAANCNMDKDTVKYLQGENYFTSGCEYPIDEGGLIPGSGDYLCYMSQAVPFTS